MSTWQQRLRLGIAAGGLAVAGAVYLGLQERQPRAPAPYVDRLDPAAVLETEGGHLQSVRGAELDFEIAAARTLSYADGSTRQFDVRITVHRGEERQYVITAAQAEAGQQRVELHLSGDVILTASDGLEMRTEEASFNQHDAVVVAPGRVTFSRGGLSGSGTGMRYDEARERLEVAADSDLRLVGGGEDEPRIRFTAVSTTLDRLGDALSLAGAVRAERAGQRLDADRADATLSPGDDAITHIALRGDARVTGGASSPGTMTAHEIDLDYGETGDALERAALRGSAVLAMDGSGGDGRRITGEALDLALAPDGSLTGASGRGGVRVDTPATDGTPAGTIAARTFAATGAPGDGLRDARFDDDVRYASTAPDGTARVVLARRLDTIFDAGTIARAHFTGAVAIEADGLDATAGEARYDPGAGTLWLRRGEGRDDPEVRDERMRIAAGTIDLALDEGRLDAAERVRTTLESGGDDAAGGLSGLLSADAPAQVTAATLAYDTGTGQARYGGSVVLWQGETALRAETLHLDQGTGHLLARGSVRSSLPLEDGRLDGRADEMTYTEETRLLTWRASPDSRDADAGVTPRADAGDRAHLVGPAGDLRARHIVVTLEPESGEVDRIEATDDVQVHTGTRRATGTHLTYRAADARYELRGARGAPVQVTDACGDTQGATLIFFTATDRMIIDGHEQVRTRTTGRRPCGEAPAP